MLCKTGATSEQEKDDRPRPTSNFESCTAEWSADSIRNESIVDLEVRQSFDCLGACDSIHDQLVSSPIQFYL